MLDKLKEECGVFGISEPEHRDVVRSSYFGLYALQHRGQESCGIAVNNRGVINYFRDLGLVPDILTADRLDELGEGNMSIGHVRYSTTGNQNRSNAQPLVIKHVKGPMALCHNGNITNASELRDEFEMGGAIFHGTNDTEVIAYLITRNRLTSDSIEQAVERSLERLKGAYSILVMSAQKLIAARDPHGFRPLCMGETPTGAIVFASESCALSSVGADFIRDIRPGEIVVVENDQVRSIETHCTKRGTLCVFEFVYFARPDSVIEGACVHDARITAGRILAQEHPVDADVVIGVPNSGLDAAMGYARESHIPYGVGFVKNSYIGRSFIQPTQGQRDNAVKIKLNVIKSTVEGKRVIIVDDSIVRGTTSGRIVKLLRDAGAKEVHMRVSCPPFTNPCYFGTDIDNKDKLIACKMTLDEISKHIRVDSLGYLSIGGVKNIAKNANCDFCVGCFTGQYPVDPPQSAPKDKFEAPLIS